MPSIPPYHIVADVPLGIPDRDGWVQKLVIRTYAGCPYAEAFHGRNNLHQQRSTIERWEVWQPNKLHSEGDMTHRQWRK